MAPMIPRGPSGLSNPKSDSTPPPNSEPPARMAQGRPGRSPMDSSQALVPPRPYPPHQPNNFCAPWPSISEPTIARKINSARLPTISPLCPPFFGISSVNFASLDVPKDPKRHTGRGPPGARRSLRGDGREASLYLLAVRLQERREGPPLTEVVRVPVPGGTR